MLGLEAKRGEAKRQIGTRCKFNHCYNLILPSLK